MNLKELKFNGDQERFNIHTGIKLTTVRKELPAYLEFRPSVVTGVFTDNLEPETIQVTHVVNRPLGEIPWVQFATNGWLGSLEATADLREYYGSMDNSSRVVALTFLLEEHFKKLKPDQRELLSKLSIDEASRHPRLRLLFFKSICQTAARHDCNVNDYIGLLYDQRLITNDEAGKAMANAPLGTRTKVMTGADLQEILNRGKTHPNYGRVVLAGLGRKS